MEARGLAGERALLAFAAGPEFIQTLLGCFLAGTVAVLVPMPRAGARTSRLDRIIEDCGAKAVLCCEAGRSSLVRHLAEVGVASEAAIVTFETLREEGAAFRPVCLRLSGRGDDVALIQYTSGSTPQPRGVLIRNENLIENGRLVERAWHLDYETMLNWMPHFHDMGLMGGLLYPMLWGRKSV